MTIHSVFMMCAISLLCSFSIGSAAAQEESGEGYGRFVELRVYRARPEHRDAFVQYFEEHFVESQEVLGSRIWGQFRDIGDSSNFVWVRGFESMAQRKSCLEQFYASDTWFEYRPGAIQMLLSAANTRLLEPIEPGDAFEPNLRRQPIAGAPYGDESWEDNAGVVVVEVFEQTAENAEDLISGIRDRVQHILIPSDAHSLGLYQSSEMPNNYPRLPMIEHEKVVVWFGTFDSEESYRAGAEAHADEKNSPHPRDTYVLSPGERSRLFHRPESE